MLHRPIETAAEDCPRVTNSSVRYREGRRSEKQKEMGEGDFTALCDEAEWGDLRVVELEPAAIRQGFFRGMDARVEQEFGDVLVRRGGGTL